MEIVPEMIIKIRLMLMLSLLLLMVGVQMSKSGETTQKPLAVEALAEIKEPTCLQFGDSLLCNEAGFKDLTEILQKEQEIQFPEFRV